MLELCGYLLNWYTWPIKWWSKVLEHNTFYNITNKSNGISVKERKKGFLFPNSFFSLKCFRVWRTQQHLFLFILHFVSNCNQNCVQQAILLFFNITFDGHSVPFHLYHSILLTLAFFYFLKQEKMRIHSFQLQKQQQKLCGFLSCIPQRKVSLQKKEENNHDFNCLKDFRC